MFFAQAILLAMGDTRKVVKFHPTELIIPTFQNRLMDGVVELDDGTLMNIEFQTGNLTEEFLLRCAQYAVNLRVISGKQVETKIFSTGIRIKSKDFAAISKKFKFKPDIYFYGEFDGLEKLINIKNKIKNYEKLTQNEHFDLIFLPFMDNINAKEVALEVFKIVNNKKLFTPQEQTQIKKCQFLVASIVSDGDKKLFEKYLGEINMYTDMLIEYERELVENAEAKGLEEGLEKGFEKGSNGRAIEIARNLKSDFCDEKIAEKTGLSIDVVKNL